MMAEIECLTQNRQPLTRSQRPGLNRLPLQVRSFASGSVSWWGLPRWSFCCCSCPCANEARAPRQNSRTSKTPLAWNRIVRFIPHLHKATQITAVLLGPRTVSCPHMHLRAQEFSGRGLRCIEAGDATLRLSCWAAPTSPAPATASLRNRAARRCCWLPRCSPDCSPRCWQTCWPWLPVPPPCTWAR